MNFWMNTALEDLYTVLKRVDVVAINDEEARQLSGMYSLVNAAKKIQQMGPEFVIIKKESMAHYYFTTRKYFLPQPYH